MSTTKFDPEILDTYNIFDVVDKIPELEKMCTRTLIQHLLQNDYYLRNDHPAFYELRDILDSEDEDSRKIYEIASSIQSGFKLGRGIEETIKEISALADSKEEQDDTKKPLLSIVCLLESILYPIDSYEVAKAVFEDYRKKQSRKQNKNAA